MCKNTRVQSFSRAIFIGNAPLSHFPDNILFEILSLTMHKYKFLFPTQWITYKKIIQNYILNFLQNLQPQVIFLEVSIYIC